MSELSIHPESEQLEGFLEGALDDAQAAVVESHLLTCERCRNEVEEWRALFGALTSIPEIEPSADFIDKVMARVRIVPAAARSSALLRWLPTTTRGWSLVAAFLALPVVGISGLVAWVLAQPWATALSVDALLVWGSSLVTSAATFLSAEAQALVLSTDATHVLANAVRDFVAVAGARGVGLAAAAFLLAAFFSVWILYHNLLRNRTRETRYAPYTI